MFGAIKLTKHVDIDLYKYSGIGFDRKGSYSISDEVGKNVMIFGVDMSSSSHIDNKLKYILFVGKGATQGLEHTLAAEKMYPVNFTTESKKFCLSLHYSGANSFCLLMVQK